MEDASGHTAPHPGSIGGRGGDCPVHDLHPRAGGRRDGQFHPLRDTKGPPGTSLIDLATVVLVVLFVFSAHLLEIALWTGLYIICGEFGDFGVAFYHSAVNYTTLGYGDIILTPSWRLLGPLEAADGMLLFGVSTAFVFTVMHSLVQTRYEDLRD